MEISGTNLLIKWLVGKTLPVHRGTNTLMKLGKEKKEFRLISKSLVP